MSLGEIVYLEMPQYKQFMINWTKITGNMRLNKSKRANFAAKLNAPQEVERGLSTKLIYRFRIKRTLMKWNKTS